jgi:phosphoribosylaminoimidazole (AIR) synthetase
VKTLKAAGETAWRIGRIERRRKNGPQVVIV